MRLEPPSTVWAPRQSKRCQTWTPTSGVQVHQLSPLMVIGNLSDWYFPFRIGTARLSVNFRGSLWSLLLSCALILSFATFPSLTPHTTHSNSQKTQQNKKKITLSFGEPMFPADFLYKSHKSSESELFLTSFLWSAALRAMESHIYTSNESHEKSTVSDFGWVWKEGAAQPGHSGHRCGDRVFLSVCCASRGGYACFCLCLYQWPCNTVCRKLWVIGSHHLSCVNLRELGTPSGDR